MNSPGPQPPTFRRTRVLAVQAALIAVGVWAISTAYHFARSAASGRLDPGFASFVLACALVGLILAAALFPVFLAARRRPRGQAIAICGAAVMAAVLLHTVFDSLVFTPLVGEEEAPLPRTLRGWAVLLMVNFGGVVVCYAVYAAGLALTLASAAIHEREMRLAQALAAAQEAQLAALRFQVNPHFLFNTLNAVVSLIGARRNAQAEAVVQRLADFFRATLAIPPNAMVTLDEELDLMSSYLHIEAARFGERLRVEIEAPEDLATAEVPHFLLQPLVENAIKHGVARTKGPVTVAIRAWQDQGALHVAVEDDGAAEGSAPAGARVGVANVAARLRALYGEDGELRTASLARGYRAEVRVPLVRPGLIRAAE